MGIRGPGGWTLKGAWYSNPHPRGPLETRPRKGPGLLLLPTPHRTEFGLDALGSGEEVVRAIRDLSYKGGNTRTGAAILHVADRVFLPQLARPGVPKVLPRPTTPPRVTPVPLPEAALT